MTSPLEDLQFWQQVLTDARRTMVCSPDVEARIKGLLAAEGMQDMVEVIVSPVCPPGQVIIIDKNALEAANRQAIQTMGRQWE